MNICGLFVCIFVLVLSFENSNTLRTKNDNTVPFASRVNEFAADFYKVLAKNVKGNFISSPISVLMVLGMAACGADGNTRRELLQTLHLPMTRGFRLTNFRSFINNLVTNSNDTNIELHLANKLFLNDHFKVEWLFGRITDEIFQTKMESIDFENANKAANKINKWCSQKTNKKITNLIKPDDLAEAKLVMLNAVYFKGNWLHPFDSDLMNRFFHFSKNNTVSIPMMCIEAEFNYGWIPHLPAKYIELPYKIDNSRKGFSMFIILPKEIHGLNSIGNQLDKIDFMKLKGPEDSIEFCMPKFRKETELDLIPTLQNMGIHEMFKDSADFSNITPENGLKITKVIQKAFINIDEKGSEAAAATGGFLGVRSGGTRIFVDRPYIAAIVSKITGTPLFWARINDPRPQST